MHTKEGSACGRKSVHDMIKKYHSIGLSGAVITNHFSRGNTAVDRSLDWDSYLDGFCKCYFDGKKTAKKYDFDLLFGLEQSYGNGKEFLVYGITPEFLYSRPYLRSAGVEEWHRELKKAGGFLAYAHPFRDRPYIKEPDAMPDLSLCDGIECYNYCNQPPENEKAEKAFKNAGLPLIAGSDLHDDNFPACFSVGFNRRIKTERDLADALRENNFTLFL